MLFGAELDTLEATVFLPFDIGLEPVALRWEIVGDERDGTRLELGIEPQFPFREA